MPITGNFTAANKVYDGNRSAVVTGRALNNVESGDTVSLDGGTATFDTKNVGNAKTVTLAGATLIGADKDNYNLTSVGTTTANITTRPLTVSATGVNKVFDGTVNAQVTLASNKVAADTVTLGYVSASFADANVGTGKPVSVTGISITGGTDAGNYALVNTTAATTANITSAPTVTQVTVTPVSRHYSDTVTFKATISPASAGPVAPATTVTFKVGALAMGTANLVAGTGTDAGKLVATLVNVPLLDAALSSPAASGPMTPGAKTVTAVFNGKNPNFTISDPTTPLTVTPEDARSTYTGDMLAFTPASGGSATVTLRATIQGITAVVGDAAWGGR